MKASEDQTADAIWLIYSREHGAWWRPKSAGYTTLVAKAGRYTFAEADARCPGSPRCGTREKGPYEEMVLAPEAFDRAPALLAENERLRKALENIKRTYIKGGPHISAKDAFQAAIEALYDARQLASAALKGES